jgi:ABC-2 type transport system ATP-binding protein
MAAVVRAAGLSKTFGALTAVDGLDLTIGRGERYGLLGPNGAGKTTTLRLLLGLQRPTGGSASVLGRPPGHPAGLARIGALVEEPGFYPYLSGRDNLDVLARLAGVDGARVDAALDTVGLVDRAGDRVKGYSYGMRQRLGVAAALLKDPDLVILDEPTNGLDPVQRDAMIELVRRIGTEFGIDVVLSSHLLEEVERVCDSVVILSGGRVVTSGGLDALRAGDAGLVVDLDGDAEAVAGRLRAAGLTVTVDGHRLVVEGAEDVAADAVRDAAVAEGAGLRRVKRRMTTLEDVFLDAQDRAVEAPVP